MAKENEIVAEINLALKSRVFASKRFQKGRFDGIAELIPTDEKELKPGISSNDGQVEYVGIDDTNPFQLYHRMESTRPDYDAEGDFGDPSSIMQTSNMLIIVMGDRFRLQLTKEDIITGISAGLLLELPKTTLNTLNIKSCKIIPGQFNVDRVAVWNEEFKTKEIDLKPNTILFSFSYQIVTYLNQACFDLCN